MHRICYFWFVFFNKSSLLCFNWPRSMSKAPIIRNGNIEFVLVFRPPVEWDIVQLKVKAPLEALFLGRKFEPHLGREHRLEDFPDQVCRHQVAKQPERKLKNTPAPCKRVRERLNAGHCGSGKPWDNSNAGMRITSKEGGQGQRTYQ